MLTPVRTVAPADALLTLAELKAHLRVDHAEEDTLLEGLIAAATAYLDGWSGVLGRCLIQQTWRQDAESFAAASPLPFPDISSVSVAYTDANGSDQALDASVYQLVNRAAGSFLVLRNGQGWPAVATRPDAVRVTLVAGYGETAAHVPAAVRQAALLLCGHWYQSREAVSMKPGESREVPLTVSALLAPFRRVGF